jgi:hypothetical protein
MNSNLFVIPNNNLVLNRYARKCSFCNCKGHNVTLCNDNELLNTNNYLIQLKNNLISSYNNNRILAIRDFENHLYDYYSHTCERRRLLTTIACRFYNTRLRSLLIVVINRLILRLFDINIEWLMLHEFNFVPFNENTPVRITSILEGIILNMTNVIYNNINEINNNINGINGINGINNNIVNFEINFEPIHENNHEMECSICYTSFVKSNSVSFKCNHEYCIDCVIQLLFKRHNNCPYCRKNIDTISCYTLCNYDKLISITNTI